MAPSNNEHQSSLPSIHPKENLANPYGPLAFTRGLGTCSVLCDPSCPARLLCPWDPPGRTTGVGCHFLPRGLPTQGSVPRLLPWQAPYHCVPWEAQDWKLLFFFKSHVYLLRPAIATWQRNPDSKMSTGGNIAGGSRRRRQSGFPLPKGEL